MEFGLLSVLTKKCTFECDHCSSSSSPKIPANFLDDSIFSVLEDFGDFEGNKKHIVSGGEPTLHPKLKEILSKSLELGYWTNVVTNASWVNPNNLSKSSKLFEKYFPEGAIVSASIDFYHLAQDKDLVKKVNLLEEFCQGRNDFLLDGCYNGREEKVKLENFLEDKNISLVPLHNLGAGRKLENLKEFNSDLSKVYCPKGHNKGFVVASDGVYSCFRGALNGISQLKISDKYSKEEVMKYFENFNVNRFNANLRKEVKSFDGSEKGINHNCDVCEKYIFG